jgi:hypothetical protein
MTDTKDLVLEHLRAMRADLSTVKTTVEDIQHHVIQLRMADAKHSEDEAHMFRRLRDYDVRLERIEKRLDLRDE